MTDDLSQLDSLDVDDLAAFCASNHFMTRAKAAEWFPERPKGYVKAARDVVHYAYNRLTGMRCRLRGDIDTAFGYERIAERIYSQLPKFARF